MLSVDRGQSTQFHSLQPFCTAPAAGGLYRREMTANPLGSCSRGQMWYRAHSKGLGNHEVPHKRREPSYLSAHPTPTTHAQPRAS